MHGRARISAMVIFELDLTSTSIVQGWIGTNGFHSLRNLSELHCRQQAYCNMQSRLFGLVWSKTSLGHLRLRCKSLCYVWRRRVWRQVRICLRVGTRPSNKVTRLIPRFRVITVSSVAVITRWELDRRHAWR